MIYTVRNNELYHHGIKGQRWGIRRFQKEDGTRTEAGKKHEASLDDGPKKKNKKSFYQKHKKAIKVGAAVAGTAAATYGAYKLRQNIKTKTGLVAADQEMKAWRSMAPGQDDSFYRDIGNRAYKTYVTNATGRKAARDYMSYMAKGGKRKDLMDVRNEDDYTIERMAARAMAGRAKRSYSDASKIAKKEYSKVSGRVKNTKTYRKAKANVDLYKLMKKNK